MIRPVTGSVGGWSDYAEIIGLVVVVLVFGGLLVCHWLGWL